MHGKSRLTIIDVEKSMGIKFPLGLHRHPGGSLIAEVNEAKVEVNNLTAYYGFYTPEQIRISHELEEASIAAFNNIGPRFWPDHPRRYQWLADPGFDDLDGRYPRELFFSVPEHNAKLSKLFCECVILQCIRYHGNHVKGKGFDGGNAPGEQDQGSDVDFGQSSSTTKTPRKSRSRRAPSSPTMNAPVAQMLPLPSQGLPTQSSSTPADQSDVQPTYRPSSEAPHGQQHGQGPSSARKTGNAKRALQTEEINVKKARFGSEDTLTSSPKATPYSAATPTTTGRPPSLLATPDDKAVKERHGSNAKSRKVKGSRGSDPRTPSQAQTPVLTRELQGNPGRIVFISEISEDSEVTSGSSSAKGKGRATITPQQGTYPGRTPTVESISHGSTDPLRPGKLSKAQQSPAEANAPIPKPDVNVVDLTTDQDEEHDMKHLQTAVDVPTTTSPNANAASEPLEGLTKIKTEQVPTSFLASSVTPTPHNVSHVLENTEVAVYWDRGTRYPSFIELEKCGTVDDFFEHINRHMPRAIRSRSIIAVNVELTNLSTTQLNDSPNCRLLYGVDQGAGAAGGFRRLLRILKEQNQDARPKLEVTFEYDN